MAISKRIGRSMMVWKWGDSEIENPRMLREQLTDIQAQGFSDVLAMLCDSRYELIDPKVIRAIAQASQWVKARGMMFWLDADPRLASRTLITRTGERLQYLLPSNKSCEPFSPTRVYQGRFEITLDLQFTSGSSGIQKKIQRLEPVGLERVFLFQMEEGHILKDSLIDITEASRFYVNTELARVEIFGEVGVPDHQEWQVLAFSKFNTDRYDFFGRESTDRMRPFVDSLFDAATYVDGMVWDEPDAIDDYCIPASDSLYAAFRLQFGYDLKDFLFALVFDVDDGSHIWVRHHYSRYLMETLYAAHSDLYSFFHTYLGEMESVLPVLWPRHQTQSPRMLPAKLDIWQNLEGSSASVGALSWPEDRKTSLDSLLARLCLLRSLGAFSKSQAAYAAFRGVWPSKEICSFGIDLLGFFSIHWIYDSGQNLLHFENKILPEDITGWNARLEEIEKITACRFPQADAAVILPMDTLISIGSEIRDEIWAVFCRFVARLLRWGVQTDVIPSALLDQAKLTAEGVRIGVRTYKSIIFPYPLVLTPKSLDVIAAMDRLHYPVFLGGEPPEFTTTGERIPHQFPLRFDPASDDLSPLLDAGVRKSFELPEGALAASVENLQNRFLLVMPDQPGGVVNGLLRFEGCEIKLSGLDRLGIFRVEKKEGKITKVF